MAEPQWTTIAMIKSGEYSGRVMTDTTLDAAITQLIIDITSQMISYLNDDDLNIDNPPTVLKRACAKQVAYEIKRREEIGLSSVTFPNGNINKLSVDEWLPDVKKILERKRYYTI